MLHLRIFYVLLKVITLHLNYKPADFYEGKVGVLGQLCTQGRLAGVGAPLEQDGHQAGTVCRRGLRRYYFFIIPISKSKNKIMI